MVRKIDDMTRNINGRKRTNNKKKLPQEDNKYYKGNHQL